MKEYLASTMMLNFENPSIQQLIDRKGWRRLAEKDRISHIYEFVRNDITFGYNQSDELTASEVLHDGYGQCNTKSTLLMALLRAVGIPCRIHGFYIDKRMQKGALTGIVYQFAPKKIVHAWTEVYFQGEWLALEGVIIDEPYLQQVKEKLCRFNNGYIGYGVAVEHPKDINVCWNGASTYIQSFSITDDLGIYASPDEFFSQFHNTDRFVKKLLFNILRKRINRQLDSLRKQNKNYVE